MRKLHGADPELASEVANLSDFWPILAVGRRASPSVCLLEAISNTSGLPTSLQQEIRKALQSRSPESKALDDLALASIRRLSRGGKRPLLVVLDELGKSLEHAALHPDDGDLYFLQQLAEMVPEWNLVFIGILHQAFDNYAQALDQSIRNEWAKIQGRFEDIPYVESPEQMMRLVAYAIEADDGAELISDGRRRCREIAEDMIAHRVIPAGIRSAEFAQLAERAYPLHPLVLALLPHLFRHHAQNERSLFAFLTLHEPFGLQQFLRTPDQSLLLGLPYLFDYVTSNFRHAVYTSILLRPVAEVEQMLLRETWGVPEAFVLKSMAMLQWAGEVTNVHPTKDVLKSAVKPVLTELQLDRILKGLRDRSAIVYRSFNRTYRVWRGSDVDVEERLQEARQQVGRQINPASVLSRLVPPLPVVAKRHSYETGTTRAFEVRYVDDLILKQLNFVSVLAPSEESYAGVVCVCLPSQKADRKEFEDWAQSPTVAKHAQAVIGVPQQWVRLNELLVELVGLEWVQNNTPALRDDPVAKRELRERADLIVKAIVEQVQVALRSCRWFYRGEEWTDRAKPSLSSLLSTVCDQLYAQTPILRNELINRWKLSTAAAAGRRKLIEAMLAHPEEERLGIKGYPPERSMYESLLRETGVHVPGVLGWRFEPPSGDNPYRLHLVWEKMYKLVFTDPPEQRNVAKVAQELAQPPYGITAGVFPVILCAFLQVYADETSLYREGTFLPDPGLADWEVLLRRPELFSVAGCRTDGEKARMLQLIGQRWGVPPKTVPIVRELVRRLRSLPDYAKRTTRLSSTAIALRQAVFQAYSPERLLFHDVPRALGVPVQETEAFCLALEQVLEELDNATQNVILWARDELLRACGYAGGGEGWQILRQQATFLRGKVLNPQLVPFLLRAAYPSGAESMDEKAALESVLALVAGRPPRSWTDAEVERFPEAARLYGEAFQQATLLASREIALGPEEEAQRDLLVQRLRQVLPDDLPARIKLSALLRLLSEGGSN
ncbi:MAG: hypothetical protein AB1751_11040 [Acidobacteriota bacterium]